MLTQFGIVVDSACWPTAIRSWLLSFYWISTSCSLKQPYSNISTNDHCLTSTSRSSFESKLLIFFFFSFSFASSPSSSSSSSVFLQPLLLIMMLMLFAIIYSLVVLSLSFLLFVFFGGGLFATLECLKKKKIWNARVSAHRRKKRWHVKMESLNILCWFIHYFSFHLSLFFSCFFKIFFSFSLKYK